MRILYIIPSIQHPDVRGPARHYYFVRELSKRHSITLLALERGDVPPEALANIASYTEQFWTFPADAGMNIHACRRWLPSREGSRLQRAWRLQRGLRAMKHALMEFLAEGKYDVVLFHGKTVFPVIQDVLVSPLAIDFCDASSLRLRMTMKFARPSALSWLLVRYLRFKRIEQLMMRKTPHLAFASGRDRAVILGSTDRARIVPNGVDLEYWRRQSDEREENCLLFSGVMDYEPNEDAALFLLDEVVPRLAQLRPDFKLLLVGRAPTPAIQERARLHPQVEVTGWVDDLRPYHERATLFVAPIRFASGLQNKIQEALAMEVPVITTPVVADGVRIDESDPPLRVATNADAFANQIHQLLQAPAERKRLAREGRQFAERHYHWRNAASEMEQLCLDAFHSSKKKLVLPGAWYQRYRIGSGEP